MLTLETKRILTSFLNYDMSKIVVTALCISRGFGNDSIRNYTTVNDCVLYFKKMVSLPVITTILICCIIYLLYSCNINKYTQVTHFENIQRIT